MNSAKQYFFIELKKKNHTAHMQHILNAHLAEERWVSRGCLLSVCEEAFQKVPNSMSIRSDTAKEILLQRRKQLRKFMSLYMYSYLDSFSTIDIISILKCIIKKTGSTF